MQVTKGFLGNTRRFRKTITFTGAANLGAAGTVPVFTITGRVLVNLTTVFCTTLLTESGATATISYGVTGAVDTFIAAVNAVDIDANEWWGDATPTAGAHQVAAGCADVAISADGIFTIAVANVTAGVLVIDVWYTPLTDNGSLS